MEIVLFIAASLMAFLAALWSGANPWRWAASGVGELIVVLFLGWPVLLPLVLGDFAGVLLTFVLDRFMRPPPPPDARA